MALRNTEQERVTLGVNRLRAPVNVMADSTARGTSERFLHKSVIYRSGEGAPQLFLVKSGAVRILASGVSKSRRLFAIVGRGDLFGDWLMRPGLDADEMAVAAGEVEVQRIEPQDSNGPARRAVSHEEVLRGFTEVVRALRHRVSSLSALPAPARVADMLVSLAEAHGVECAHGGHYDLRFITQQDLADLTGCSRAFVCTMVNDLKRQGLLGSAGRILCIKNSKALKQRSRTHAASPQT
jgi:CRP-like cAMP-binding protein